MDLVVIAVFAGLVIYLGAAFGLGKLLSLPTSDFYILFGALAAIGILAAAAILWWRIKSRGDTLSTGTVDAARSDEMDGIVKEAEAKLAASKLARGAALAHLPLVYVLGDQGSTKTTVILQSGLEPELLAGQVYQDTTVVSTRTANLWFAKDVVFAEAGMAIQSDPGRWVRFVRRLRPRALKSVVGRGSQAPRAAIVCVSSEAFTHAGAAEKLAKLSRDLQARLGEVSQSLGISFPVYVLFTKADRLPFFPDFIRTLTNDEASQVFGVTLPMRSTLSGVYAEAEAQRLTSAFEGLYHSLADRRLEFLPRESDLERIPGAYEFPREFRKLRGPLIQFLVDVCRPSQLRASPFLRGFYFCGVRPVVVQDTVAPARTASVGRAAEVASSATGVFHTPVMGAVPQPIAQPQFAGTKRVPQWVFLSRLFHNVILLDRAAMAASGSSTKTSMLQRGLLAGAAVLSLVLALGFTVSYLKNRAMVNNAMSAVAVMKTENAGEGPVPSLDALQRLEAVRVALEELTRHRTEGRPFSMGWGLYAGDEIYPDVRAGYYRRFSQLLFANAQGALITHMQRLPSAPGPGNEHGPTYNILKGYLITTSHNEKANDSSPAPELQARWADGRGVDAPRMELAQRQFQFYARDLKNGNPYSSTPDGVAVERARSYLAKFLGLESVYQYMLSSAGKKSVNYNREIKDSPQVVVNAVDIPGAFTKAGYDFMQDALRRADQFFAGEEWVLGNYKGTVSDRAKLSEDLSTKYVGDFIKHWRNYFTSTSVRRYADLRDASKKLNLQAGVQSPILGLFWLASQHTGVDFTKVQGGDRIQKAFQSVHHVVPPGTVDRYLGPNSQSYMNALVTLQASIDQAANMPKVDPTPAMNNATAAHIAVKQLSQGFNIDKEADLGTTVGKLLDAPITHAEDLLRTLGPAELNGAGAGLCSQIGPILNKFPFNPMSPADATVQEVQTVLKPGEGAIWGFYEANLKNALLKQGHQYVPNNTVPIHPAFLNWFNSMARLAEALYSGGPDPKLAYTVKPLKSEAIQNLTFSFDGQAVDSNSGQAKSFTAPGSGQGAKLIARLGTLDLPASKFFEGPWASLRLFNDAERWEQTGSSYRLDWPLSTKASSTDVRILVDFGSTPAFFKKGNVPPGCVSRVAR